MAAVGDLRELDRLVEVTHIVEWRTEVAFAQLSQLGPNRDLRVRLRYAPSAIYDDCEQITDATLNRCGIFSRETIPVRRFEI